MQRVDLWLELAEIPAQILAAAALPAASSVLVADDLVDDRSDKDEHEEEGHKDSHYRIEYDYLPPVLDALLHDRFSLEVTEGASQLNRLRGELLQVHGHLGLLFAFLGMRFLVRLLLL